jgi:hypothetical protein
MSDGYWCFPVTKSRPLTLGTGVPAIFQSLAGISGPLPETVATSFSPLVSCGRGHGAQARAHLRSGLAAKGALVERSQVGVAHHHGDGVEGNHQFFRHQLGQRSADILADFNLAGEDGDFVVSGDVDPRGYVAGNLLAAAEAAAAGLLGPCRRIAKANQQASAEELEEDAAVQREAARRVGWIRQCDIGNIGEEGAHRAPPLAIDIEARCTASTMRG